MSDLVKQLQEQAEAEIPSGMIVCHCPCGCLRYFEPYLTGGAHGGVREDLVCRDCADITHYLSVQERLCR